MSFTNAQLAQQIANLIEYWAAFNQEYSDWIGGTVGGGPNSDGEYPLTNWAGEETLLPCPALLSDNVTGYVATVAASASAASDSEIAAALSETNAAASAVTATAQAVLADADRVAAELAETGATDAKVTAIAQAAAAVVSAAAALASEQAAAASEAAAAISETNAAASAAAAATFDPALFAELSTPNDFAGDVNIVGGQSLYVWDAGDTDNIRVRHDGNNAIMQFTNTSNFDIGSGLTAQVRWYAPFYLMDGNYFRWWGPSASGSKAVTASHNGTNFVVTTSLTQTDDYQFLGFNGNLDLRDGMGLKIRDAGDTDLVEMSHDGVDFNMVGTNTADINVTGITSFNVPALAATGAVTGSNLNVANWDTAYGWGDHAGLYSLAAHNHSGVYEPVDATIVRTGDAGYLKTNWDTAYGWGDHAGLYAPISNNFALTTGDNFTGVVYFTNANALRINNNSKLLGLNFAATQNVDLLRVATNDTIQVGQSSFDLNIASATMTAAGSIAAVGAVTGSNLNVSNWDTAFGWGDHAAQNYADKDVANTYSGTSYFSAYATLANNVPLYGNTGAGYKVIAMMNASDQVVLGGTSNLTMINGTSLTLNPTVINSYASAILQAPASASVSNQYNVTTNAYDVDMQYRIGGTLTALVRWDSSANTFQWMDRAPGTVVGMTLNLEDSSLAVTGAVTAATYNGATIPAYNVFTGGGLVTRHGSGYIYSNYFNQSIASGTSSTPTHVPVCTGSDGFYRWQTLANFKLNVGIDAKAPLASPTFTGNVTAPLLYANTVQTLGGNYLIINAGESHAYATGQTGEAVYLNAEGGIQVNSSPDNWATGWATRKTATICDTAGDSTFPGDVNASGYFRTNGPDTKPAVGYSALSANMLHIDGKEAIDGNDGYLRLNQNVDFASGVHIPSNLLVYGQTNSRNTVPTTHATYSLGSSGSYWSNAYIQNIQLGSIDCTISRVAASKPGVEGKALFKHAGAYTSGEVTYSTAAPSGGSSGDIWFKYTA
jgi:hypothetical protein